MNEKLNIQDLIDLLAEKHGMSKKNADSFVKEFFLLIEEALEKDKYVKVKGLGTFKLIDVDSRESVNVNTGERFEIQGHSKVSFTPEPALKDVINKPFSHFETVVLNDDTVFEDVSLEKENEAEEEAESTNIEKTVVAVVTIPERAIGEEALTIPKATEKPVITKPSIAAIKREEALQMESEIVGVNNPANSTTMKFFTGIVLFVVILCIGAIVFLCYPDLLGSSTVKPFEKEVVKTEIDAGLGNTLVSRDTLRTDTINEILDKSSVIDSQKDANVEEQLVSKPKVESSSLTEEPKKVIVTLGGYAIDGTKAIYTVGDGETLMKISMHFYGSKTLWSYIVKYNPDAIKNPDYVPAGTKIKIPNLVKKQ